MPFSGPFRYYSIFVLLFVTIRRFGGPSLTDKCAAQKLKKIAVLVYGHVYMGTMFTSHGHIKKPK